MNHLRIVVGFICLLVLLYSYVLADSRVNSAVRVKRSAETDQLNSACRAIHACEECGYTTCKVLRCRKCIAGYALQRQRNSCIATSVDCSSIPGCTSCVLNGVLECTACNSASVLQDGVCAVHCSSIPGCRSCVFVDDAGPGRVDCTECNPAYALQGRFCTACSTITGCSACSVNEGNMLVCTACGAGFVLNFVIGICIACPDGCTDCIGNPGTGQLECNVCDEGFTLEENTCTACGTITVGCNACTVSALVLNELECTACVPGFRFNSKLGCVFDCSTMSGCTRCVLIDFRPACIVCHSPLLPSDDDCRDTCGDRLAEGGRACFACMGGCSVYTRGENGLESNPCTQEQLGLIDTTCVGNMP